MAGWSEKSPEVVGARYDRLAPIYGLFEWLYGLPLVRFRKKSIDALALNPGDSVLEIGCGSGRNFALIEERIGPSGRLFGVDLSRGMLSRAERLTRLRGWTNVQLTRVDAALSLPSESVCAVLFSFSYSTMRDRLSILDAAWKVLEAGGHAVITDARLRIGWPRRILARTSHWFSSRTLLGRPDTDPEIDLADLAGAVSMQRIAFKPFGFEYVVCSAKKCAAAQQGAAAAPGPSGSAGER
jgi:demethylmenaquinone methyltransferase/2-methoxy-6-polyprenyl-1,4-benzoquinol methylase